jgi:hypothetical protein
MLMSGADVPLLFQLDTETGHWKTTSLTVIQVIGGPVVRESRI